MSNILDNQEHISESLVEYMHKELKEMDVYFQGKYNLQLSQCSPTNTEYIDENNYKTDVWMSIYNKLFELDQLWIQHKVDKTSYIQNAEKTLNKAIHGNIVAKNEIKQIIGQWINGEMKGACFGLWGEAGVGKTTLALEGFAKCITDDNGVPRPFVFIPLGGSSNGAMLIGHSFTYLGSKWGDIVDNLMRIGCMNPIWYFDEIDKVSMSPLGREVSDILTHMTDPVQNAQFYDKYFSNVPLDISKSIFIFSYNEPDKIPEILRNRIKEIRIPNPTVDEKIHIARNFMLPKIYKSLGMDIEEVHISDELLKQIINTYVNEPGLRKLDEFLHSILREINLYKIMNSDWTAPFNVEFVWVRKFMNDRVENKIDHMATMYT